MVLVVLEQDNNKKRNFSEEENDKIEKAKIRINQYNQTEKVIYYWLKEIEELRNLMTTIASVNSNTENFKGGSNKDGENKNIKFIDKIDEIKEKIMELRFSNDDVRYAISKVTEDIDKKILYAKWINKTDSIRGLEKKLLVSRTEISRRNKNILLNMYKNIEKYNKLYYVK